MAPEEHIEETKGVQLSPEFERAVLYGTLEELIDDAVKGNKISAREILFIAIYYLHPNRTDLKTEPSEQMPKALRKYLHDSLVKISLGTPADKAFHFKEPGKPGWGFMAKRLGAYLVYGGVVEMGYSFHTALSKATQHLQEQIHNKTLRGPWKCFENKDMPQEATLRDWYYDEKDYLDTLRKQYP